jgi:protein TonB
LRKTYNSRIKKAMIFTGSVILLIFIGSIVYGVVNKKSAKDDLEVVDTQMAEIKKDEPPPPPPPPPPPTPPPPPEVNQVKFTPPKIVKDEEVKPDEKIEEIKEEQVISTETVKSENTTQIVQAPVEDKGTQVVEVPVKADDENKVFNKVEVEAEFPGGSGAWRNYLQKNLNASTPIDNGASEGTYQVIVKFIVSKDGSISDVQAETKFGYGMEEEAIKVIKRGPKWTPALQNGRHVNAYRRQPITFVVAEQ